MKSSARLLRLKRQLSRSVLLPFCKSEWNSFTGGRITALDSGQRIAKRIHFQQNLFFCALHGSKSHLARSHLSISTRQIKLRCFPVANSIIFTFLGLTLPLPDS